MPPIRSGQYINDQYDTPSRASNIAQRSPRYQLAPYERAKLVELKAIGWSYKNIHKRYSHIPIGTIKTMISRSRQRGPAQETLPRSGRPKALNDEERTMLLDLIRDDPYIKYNDLLSRLNHKVSRQTLWTFFCGLNKRKWLVLQRPELYEEYARKRRA